MKRRRIALVLAALATVATVAVAVPALAGEDPPPCATGAFTSYSVKEVSHAGVYAPRAFLRLDGWIGPCGSGAPLPTGFRRVPYYRDGVIIHYTPDPDPFTSTTGPTTFGEYVGVDAALPDGGPLVAICLAYDTVQRISCLKVEGWEMGKTTTLVPVPTSYVTDNVAVWPPNQIEALHPDPTCGTCV
jgi:hypothetical protein